MSSGITAIAVFDGSIKGMVTFTDNLENNNVEIFLNTDIYKNNNDLVDNNDYNKYKSNI